MKTLLLIFPLVLLTACESMLYSPQTGKPLAKMQSDMTNVSYSGAGVTFHADRMSNSVPTRAALLGANKIVGTVGSAATAVLVPGSGAVPLIGKAAISAVPHLASPVAKPGD